MTDKQKIAYLEQSVKNIMVTINDLEETQDISKQAGYYEINIIATLLHDAEIINTKDFLAIVRLYPYIEPFSRLNQINNKAIGFIESGPYCENEPQTIIDTVREIERLSSLYPS